MSSALTVMACMVYLGARIVHYFAYMLAIPIIRTVSFLVGFGCQATLAAHLLGVL
jgi:uncharacterized MAPEG superfamily protein